ncbi:heparinase II/III family protein [Oleiphilus messinensis]|uniref:Heparinase II/III family protein n=2 Tax=Oleiphilus messinensis TaxID=141451 RepID=A0A1Y0IGA2_9GAMM|nr:heparinase II/III family protein [Oleiphilus messinensis]
MEVWRENQKPFIGENLSEIEDFLYTQLTASDRIRILERGRDAAIGKILAFRGWRADYSWPIDWFIDPKSGYRWQPCHASEVLQRAKPGPTGDIKNCWEFARFLHVPDIVRAYLVSKDIQLIDRLMAQWQSFSELNPINQGPHWVSEQEVAIRGLMAIYTLYVLEHAGLLTESWFDTLMDQISCCAYFCFEDIEFARRCISNNHYLAGILGFYLPSILFSGLPQAAQWRKRGRAYLIEVLESQWHEDGGYIQPSHNYHRLALGYLTWVRKLAQLDQDTDLLSLIDNRLVMSRALLSVMQVGKKGELPNWGPNDGAYFVPWCETDFADFRPILAVVNRILDQNTALEPGPWDEALIWLGLSGHRNRQVQLNSAHSDQPGLHCFSKAGLMLHRRQNWSGVLRCGPVLSRYGQQADQLHFDFWWKGNNVLVDAGSGCYADPKIHEWYRGTAGHNTIQIDMQSQMNPYRPFLFLDWAHGIAQKGLPGELFGGYHSGYSRKDRLTYHYRWCLPVDQGCYVIDYVQTDSPVNIDLAWHLGAYPAHNVKRGVYSVPVHKDELTLSWLCSLPDVQEHLVEAGEHFPDASFSRHYGEFEHASTIHLRGWVTSGAVILTAIGQFDLVDAVVTGNTVQIPGRIDVAIDELLRAQ